MEKQKMLYQQARLHDRGAAEMVLQMISASKGSKTHTPVCCPAAAIFGQFIVHFASPQVDLVPL